MKRKIGDVIRNMGVKDLERGVVAIVDAEQVSTEEQDSWVFSIDSNMRLRAFFKRDIDDESKFKPCGHVSGFHELCEIVESEKAKDHIGEENENS